MPTKLDIGCGGKGSRRPGFIGIDIWPKPAGNPAPYYRLNFVKDKLPWGPNTVDEIIALHIIEHLTRPEGLTMIRLAHRLLKPGARMTIMCPDLKQLATAYVNNDNKFLEKTHLDGKTQIWPGLTPADRLNWAIHQDTHKWSYDEHSLQAVVGEALGDCPGTICQLTSYMDPPSPYNFRPDHEIGIEITKGPAT